MGVRDTHPDLTNNDPLASVAPGVVGPIEGMLIRLAAAEREQASKRLLAGQPDTMPDEQSYRKSWSDLLDVAHALPRQLKTCEAVNTAHEIYNFLRIAWEENLLHILAEPEHGYAYIKEKLTLQRSGRNILSNNPLCATAAPVAPLAEGGWAYWPGIQAAILRHRRLSGNANAAAAYASATAGAARLHVPPPAPPQAPAGPARPAGAAGNPPSGTTTTGTTGAPPVGEAQLEAHYALKGLTDFAKPPFNPYECMCAGCGNFGHSTHKDPTVTGCTASATERESRPYMGLATRHKARWSPADGSGAPGAYA